MDARHSPTKLRLLYCRCSICFIVILLTSHILPGPHRVCALYIMGETKSEYHQIQYVVLEEEEEN